MSPPDGHGGADPPTGRGRPRPKKTAPKATTKPASKKKEPAPPLIAPTGSPGLDTVADVVNRKAAPFMNAPDPKQGAAGWVAHGIGAVTGVIGAPAELIDTAFAAATGFIADCFAPVPACTLGALHIGTPHTHAHPPSLVPPAPPVPLPSFGNVLGSGAVTVLLCGLPAARAGDIGIAVTCGSLAPPFEIFTGSSNVFIGGSRAARVLDITRHCNPSSMGAFSVAMGAAGVVGGAAGAIATGNAYMAAQAAADAAVLGIKMLCGKDPAGPPGIGALAGPAAPTVEIGGFPCPPLGEMAVGAIMKKLKSAFKAYKSIRNTRRVCGSCGEAGEPIYLPTGEAFNTFVDFVSGGLFEWRRHVTSARAAEPGPHGNGWRHYYQRSLSVRLHRAVFTDWDGERFELPRFRRGSDTVRGQGYTLRRIRRGRYSLSYGDEPVMEFEGGEFDGELPLVRITDKDRDLQLSYDSNGQLCGATEWSRGGARERRAWKVECDSSGRIVKVVEVAGGGRPSERAAFEYDADGQLVRVKDALGSVASYEYDAFHRVTKQIDERGYAFTYAYDVWGRCVRASGADGLWASEMEYFPEEGFTRYTEGDGRAWECHYDDDHFVTKIVDPYGGETTRERDDEGRLVREVDPGGRELWWLYDDDDVHFGRVDRFGYLHPPEAEVPWRDNPLRRDLPSTSVAWQHGGLFEVSSAAHRGMSPTVLATVPDRVAIIARTCAQERQGPPTPLPAPRIELDALGRKTKETDALGRVRAWRYDAAGNVVDSRDRDGRSHEQRTTSWNLVGEKRDPAGHAMRYRYSKIEQVVSVTDPSGTVSQYEYDFAERLVRVHRDGRLREEYIYEDDHFVEKRDGDGNVLFRNEIHDNHEVAIRRLANGGLHRYDYDTAGRITEASTDEHEVRLRHGVDGRRIHDLRDDEGVEHLQDGRSRVLGRFELLQRHVQSGSTEQRDPAGGWSRLRHGEDGTVLRNCANGSNELSQYDGDGKLVAQVVYREGTDGGLSGWAVRYVYSPHGDLLRVDDNARGSTAYEVDAAHRLTAERTPDGKRRAFELDAAGNVLSKPGLPRVEVGRANRLVASGSEVFEYDTRDRLVVRRRADGSEIRYVYDSFDMLVAVEGRQWRAKYDAVGRRIWSDARGERREFYWDGDRLAAEVFVDGTLRIYQYAGHHALVPVAFVDYESVHAEPETGRAYQVFSNQVGMPLCIEDGAGRVVWWADRIDPYGAIDVRADASIEYNLRWPGHYFDAATGLHYNRYRYYDPVLGRYLQSDPLGYEGSAVNLYAYASNPLVEVDVLGLSCKSGKSSRGAGDSDGQEGTTPVPKKKRQQGPRTGGDEVGDDGLSDRQRRYFRKRIDTAEAPPPDPKAAAQARYDRNRRSRANRDLDPLDPNDWAASADRAKANRIRGNEDENKALDVLGLENNNSADAKTHTTEAGVKTRPDAVTDKAVVDVKSMPDTPTEDGKPRVLHNSQQLRAQQEMAGTDKRPVVVMTNGDKTAVRPSKPLAHDANVLHRDTKTGKWSRWDRSTGEWKSTTKAKVQKLTGGG